MSVPFFAFFPSLLIGAAQVYSQGSSVAPSLKPRRFWPENAKKQLEGNAPARKSKHRLRKLADCGRKKGGKEKEREREIKTKSGGNGGRGSKRKEQKKWKYCSESHVCCGFRGGVPTWSCDPSAKRLECSGLSQLLVAGFVG